VPSFLFGCALLVGNGDIAGGALLESVFGSSTVSIKPEVWAPFVVLILAALLPLLHPRRLLQSGLRPQRKWERAIFVAASMALLVGLPLCLIGLLARENISGYNDFAYRDTIRQDVQSWPSLLAMILPHQDDESAGEQKLKVEAVRAALARMPAQQGKSLAQAEAQWSMLEKSVLGIAEPKPKAGKDRSIADTVKTMLGIAEPKPNADSNDSSDASAGKDRSAVDPVTTLGIAASLVTDSNTRDRFIGQLEKEVWDSSNPPQVLRTPDKRPAWDALRLVSLLSLQAAHRQPHPNEAPETIDQVANVIMSWPIPSNAKASSRKGADDAAPGDASSGNAIDKLPPPPLKLMNVVFSRQEVRDYLKLTKDRWARDSLDRSQSEERTSLSEPLRQLQQLLDGSLRQHDGSEAWERFADGQPWPFLYLRTWELVHASNASERRRRRVMEAPDYYRERSFLQPVSGYVRRVYDVVGWMFGADNDVSLYWAAKERQDVLQEQIVYVLNRHLFADRALLDRQVEILLQSIKEKEEGKTAQNLDEQLRETLAASPAAYAAGFAAQVSRTHRAGAADLQKEDVGRVNRLLLEQSFPRVLRPRSQIRRLISIYQDQWSRCKWLVVFLVVFLAFGLLDLNALSMHRYYRDRVVEAFLVYKEGKDRAIPLSEIDTTRFGWPYHLISTTVSAPGAFSAMRKRAPSIAAASPQEDRYWLESFLLSARYCGSHVTGYMETPLYEKRILGDLNKLSLAEAIALSGAAISPGHTNNLLITFLMMAFNFRLGQWMPNPRGDKPTRQPRILSLLACLLRYHGDRPYCFITDGGISENLGLVQLLQRQCRLIVAVDAGHDPHHDFVDLAKAIRIARIHGGVRLVRLDADSTDIDDELQPGNLDLPTSKKTKSGEDSTDQRLVKDHVLLAKIEYPDAEPGLLIYVKPSFTGDEPLDLVEYRRLNAEFPHESTTDQAYDPRQVESYRRLGYHIGARVGQLFEKIRQNGTLGDIEVTVDQLVDELISRGARPDDVPTSATSGGAIAEDMPTDTAIPAEPTAPAAADGAAAAAAEAEPISPVPSRRRQRQPARRRPK
jgi:hypothetical protein